MPDFKKVYSTIEADNFPEDLTILFGDKRLLYKKRRWTIDGAAKGLRYGENPGQPAALYQLGAIDFELAGRRLRQPGDAIISGLSAKQILNSGKHPGKTNLTDVDNGINILQYLAAKPACVILKHNNPCGAAWATESDGGIFSALKKALACDRIAAFGGVVVSNSTLSQDAAELLAANYFEVIAAPAYEGNSVRILSCRKNLRLLEIPDLVNLAKMKQSVYLDFKSLSDGGLIVQQSWQNRILTISDFQPAVAENKDGTIVIARKPTPKQLEDLFFGWAVESGVSSNSVIFCKNGATIAIGAGEQDRVGVVELAVFKAYSRYADNLAREILGLSIYELRRCAKTDTLLAEKLAEIEEQTRQAKGGLIDSCLISDGFFPFRDGVDAAIEQGISAIAQPGGSLRDAEVIMACNEAEPPVSMVFTGQRSFKH